MIYVKVLNFFGNYKDLAKEFNRDVPGEVEVFNHDMLLFKELNGQSVSNLMEAHGCDYEYSYEPESFGFKEEK